MRFARIGRGGLLLAALTLGVGGLFKLVAFAREAFIASHFGLSAVTDAYFAFQQFPLMVATFVFGAFALAFAPAYAAEKRAEGYVPWLPGLLFYGIAISLVLSVVAIVCAPWLLRWFSSVPSADARWTLILLSFAFAPITCLGIWAAVAVANGRNLSALFVTGLPYLIMTLLLLGNVSLPASFLFGFGSVGLWALFRLLTAECRGLGFRRTWEMPGFRSFLRQLSASSLENVGYSANQLLLVYFLAATGTGAVTANTCAMRVGMLGFSLLGQPLAQLVQAKLCAAEEAGRRELFRKWFLAVGAAVLSFAAALYALRDVLTRMVYLHGKFSALDLAKVEEIMPAWIGYFVVASLNAMAARYLFTSTQGAVYVRRQLWAYAAANLFRLACWGRLGAPGIVWASVAAEGCALLLSLRAIFWQTRESAVESAPLAEAQRV